MNTLDTLYFPDTALTTDRQFPLFLLFSTVHLIRPVEPADKSEENSMDTFMDHQFCQAHTPHPLGKDRDRFLYLINDIKNRKDDYAAQLSHITLASMTEKRGKSDPSKNEIMSSLLGKPVSSSNDAAEKMQESLWQARLVLKIGEILDLEEEEVAQALIHLEESETDLFDKLKGKDSDAAETLYEELVNIKSKLNMPRAGSMVNRLLAWFKLTQGSELPTCPVWTTTRQEVADILFEKYENNKGSAPILIAEVELPARTGRDSDQLLKKLSAFRAEFPDETAAFANLLVSTSSNLSQEKNFLKFLPDWKKGLEKYFPSTEYGRSPARFYLFEGHLALFSGSKAEQSPTEKMILCVFSS